ncbi:MAG TPA: type II secretion system protein GspL [Steroidobacteraceae bacterium]|nr:type II secretion system protein GspL [Steroidobacteraceae bacterium]
MSETLVIRLPAAADDAAAWVVTDGLGQRIAGMQRGPLSLAAAMVSNRRVVALVPGSDVLLTEPELPVRGGSRLQQVVPFALEDSLADDVESMHFAVGRRTARPGTPVAAVASERMRDWVAQIAGAGLRVDAMHADTSLLPANPGQIVVALEGSLLRVRRPDALPVTLPASPLADALTIAGALDPDPAIASTQHLLVYAPQSEWGAWQAETEALVERCATLRVQILPDGLLPLFAQQLACETVDEQPINLLQGAFGRQTGFAANWSAWRTSTVLAGVLLVTHLAAEGLELWRLKSAERKNLLAIEQVFHQALPEARNSANARQQMEGRLGLARSGSSKTGLLESLGALGGALTQVPSTSLSSMSYRDTILDLKLSAPDVASLDQITRLVTQRGFTASLEGTNQQGAQFEGRLQIRTGGKS